MIAPEFKHVVHDAEDPNHTPPLTQAVPLGLQHVLAMFAGNVTVPVIISGVIGADATEKAAVSWHVNTPRDSRPARQ